MVIAGHHAGLPKNLGFEDERIKADEKRARLAAARKGGTPADLLSREIPTLPAHLTPKALASLDDKEQKIRRYEFWVTVHRSRVTSV
jgi:hypothetical protein